MCQGTRGGWLCISAGRNVERSCKNVIYKYSLRSDWDIHKAGDMPQGAAGSPSPDCTLWELTGSFVCMGRTSRSLPRQSYTLQACLPWGLEYLGNTDPVLPVPGWGADPGGTGAGVVLPHINVFHPHLLMVFQIVYIMPNNLFHSPHVVTAAQVIQDYSPLSVRLDLKRTPV